MYSPVFLSCPTTSGSPPVLSISLSDHSFSVLASSFACILAHSRPLWRFMFFSKRAFHALSSCSHCSGDKPFLLLLMFLAVVALIVVASCVSYLLLRCAPPHGSSFGLSLRDRKSTRLNSSHANISYAVFCLKKQKNILPRYSWLL